MRVTSISAPPEISLTFIFQTPRLLPWRTVYENIALVLPDGDPRRAEIPAMIDRVGLAEAANAYPDGCRSACSAARHSHAGSSFNPKSY